MLRYPKLQTSNSNQKIDRTKIFFVKQIPTLHLRKYGLTPLQKEVLNELHYQCYMKATKEDPLETSSKEISLYLDRTERSVREAIHFLADLGIISLTITRGKGTTGVKIYFLVNLLEESDSCLYPLVKSLKKKLPASEEIETEKINSELETKPSSSAPVSLEPTQTSDLSSEDSVPSIPLDSSLNPSLVN